MRPIYRTPLGCFDTWEDAARAIESRDMDPVTCIEIVRPNYNDIGTIYEYGMACKLSNAVRCF